MDAHDNALKRTSHTADEMMGDARDPEPRQVDQQKSSTYIVHMKAVQVVFDERTLEQLDALAEVKKEGRSAVLRRVTEDFLNLRRQEAIDEQYRRGYSDGEGLGEEWAGWVEEAAWPKE